MMDSSPRQREVRRYVRHGARMRTAPVEAQRYRRTRANRKLALPPTRDGDAVARRPLRLGVLVFIQYALLAVDMRFVASANYLGIAIANVCIATTTWYLTREIVTARTVTDRICFAVGGTAGALLAVYVT